MVTRDDVARRAGTSTAVVSYVVNNGPRNVSPKTRENVLAAIEELGYRPNGVARALRSTRSRLLGLVLPDNANPVFAELAHAIEEEAFRRGYFLLLGNSYENDERQTAYVREFLELRVEGILLIGAASRQRNADPTLGLADLRGLKMPIVVIDRAITGSSVSHVTVENMLGGFLATQHLLQHGHREIACMAGPEGSHTPDLRIEGWRKALRQVGVESDDQILLRSPFRREASYQAFLQFLKENDAPKALFAESDEHAIGVLRAAAEFGLRVPEDLAIVSFDGIPESGFTNPRLTTVVQPFGELGRQAVEVALSDVDNSAGLQIKLPVELAIRESCGCSAARLSGHGPILSK